MRRRSPVNAGLFATMTASARSRFMAEKAASKSLGPRATALCSTIPRALAPASVSRTPRADARLSESHRMATRDARGSNCLRSSSRFPASSLCIDVTPVTFPPGRARLATSPNSTGSEPDAVTIGIELVSCLAASVASLLAVTMISTLASISSAARLGRRPTCPFPHRGSKMTFCPSTYPSSRGRAANQVRVGYQPPDRQSARPYDPPIAAGACGRGDPVVDQTAIDISATVTGVCRAPGVSVRSVERSRFGNQAPKRIIHSIKLSARSRSSMGW